MPNLSKMLAFLALAALAGCSKPAAPKTYYVDRVVLAEGTLTGNPALAMGTPELKRELDQAFARSKRFVPLAPTTRPRPDDLKALRCRLEVAFTRESLDEATGTSKVEVGVVFELRHAGEVDRWQTTGLGRASLTPSDAAARVPAFRQALAGALDEVVKSGALQLDALDKPDAELIADLGSTDPRKRDFAVRLLADRRNSAAVPALIERLKDPDREVAMKAVGALGSIGDPKAVPALIEMSQTRDPQFLIALIDVVAGLGGTDAEAFLFTLASGHPDPPVRLAAREAQERLQRPDAGPTE